MSAARPDRSARASPAEIRGAVQMIGKQDSDHNDEGQSNQQSDFGLRVITSPRQAVGSGQQAVTASTAVYCLLRAARCLLALPFQQLTIRNE